MAARISHCRVISMGCATRSSGRPPLPVWTPSGSAQPLSEWIRLLTLRGVPLLSGRRSDNPGHPSADWPLPRLRAYLEVLRVTGLAAGVKGVDISLAEGWTEAASKSAHRRARGQYAPDLRIRQWSRQ
jgi:hypothetical protein